jgi:predicted transposase YbfD/YdcC
VLARTKVNEKSNEVVAISALLDMLSIGGAIVTIDAMGCQRHIAQKIIDRRADYVLALKGNQGTLRDDVELFANEQRESQRAADPRDIEGEKLRIRHLARGHRELAVTRPGHMALDLDVVGLVGEQQARRFGVLHQPTPHIFVCRVAAGELVAPELENIVSPRDGRERERAGASSPSTIWSISSTAKPEISIEASSRINPEPASA